MFRLALAATTSLFFAAAAVPAQAAGNLLVNGGFETGDLTGWTDGGNTGWNTVATNAPFEGTHNISNGAVGSFSLLSQTVATTPGASYDLSFALQSTGASLFEVLWDGVLVDTQGPPGGPYVVYHYTVTGTGSDTVTFGFRDDPSFLNFDAAQLVDAIAAIPEPISIALLGTGLIGLGLARRRKS